MSVVKAFCLPWRRNPGKKMLSGTLGYSFLFGATYRIVERPNVLAVLITSLFKT
jgi:hypothetical protein